MPSEHKKTEDEWFARNERELIRSLKRERERKQKELEEQQRQEQARKLKELHWMKCPKCGNDMKEQEIEGIRVDRCSVCEGIYLDRGELEELMLKHGEQRRSFMRKIIGIFHA